MKNATRSTLARSSLTRKESPIENVPNDTESVKNVAANKRRKLDNDHKKEETAISTEKSPRRSRKDKSLDAGDPTDEDRELLSSQSPASSLSGTPGTISNASSAPSSRSSSTSRPKRYLCDYEGCDKAYSKPSLLEQHKRSHENIRPFKCDEPDCDKAFFRKSHLDIHMLSHKSADDKPFKCKICGKGVNTRQHLKRHEITHTKSFKCSFQGCEVSFYKNYQLKNHIASVHENRLRCPDCGKDFSRPLRLANHREKVHGSEPSYQCTHAKCMSLFKTWSALQFHIKTEHPKVQCTVCGKYCVGDAGLRMHMIIHDEKKVIKIWNCKACPSTFQKKANLVYHYEADHPDVPLPVSLLQEPIQRAEVDPSSDRKTGRMSRSVTRSSPMRFAYSADQDGDADALPLGLLGEHSTIVTREDVAFANSKKANYDDDNASHAALEKLSSQRHFNTSNVRGSSSSNSAKSPSRSNSGTFEAHDTVRQGDWSDSSTGSKRSVSEILSRSSLRSVFDIIAYQGEKQTKTRPCSYTHCDRMFKNDYDLRRHLNWHAGVKKGLRAAREASETSEQNEAKNTEVAEPHQESEFEVPVSGEKRAGKVSIDSIIGPKAQGSAKKT